MGPTRAKIQQYKETAELAQALAVEEDALMQEFQRLKSETQSD